MSKVGDTDSCVSKLYVDWKWKPELHHDPEILGTWCKD